MWLQDGDDAAHRSVNEPFFFMSSSSSQALQCDTRTQTKPIVRESVKWLIFDSGQQRKN